jgi:hypothetical protein
MDDTAGGADTPRSAWQAQAIALTRPVVNAKKWAETGDYDCQFILAIGLYMAVSVE